MLRLVAVAAYALCVLLAIGNSEITNQECTADGSCTETNSEEQGSDACRDFHDLCQFWADDGECQANSVYMFDHCPKACSVCFGEKQQLLNTSVDPDRLVEILRDAKEYVDIFRLNETVKPVWDLCAKSLRNSKCALWAAQGECDANPRFMRLNCAPICRTCEYLDIAIRCPIDDVTDGVWGPGDLEKFFVNLTTIASREYDVNIISQPPEGPWIVSIENFLTSEEASHITELGEMEGYKNSLGFNGLREDGTPIDVISESRTSSNTWCEGSCSQNQTAQRIVNRIEDLTSITNENHEHLQLLSYDVGQFYRAHHDLIPHHFDRQPGVRILTVFLYLNTVESGGGTCFPLLNNITVEPKVGRALIWPSVQDDEPHVKDPRTQHEALPVLVGQKFAANAWIHQRPFKESHEKGCV